MTAVLVLVLWPVAGVVTCAFYATVRHVFVVLSERS